VENNLCILLVYRIRICKKHHTLQNKYLYFIVSIDFGIIIVINTVAIISFATLIVIIIITANY
jgi:hypothetical protein